MLHNIARQANIPFEEPAVESDADDMSEEFSDNAMIGAEMRNHIIDQYFT